MTAMDGDKNGGYQLPEASTDAPPGSPAKIRVLTARRRAGTCLWHPADAEGVRHLQVRGRASDPASLALLLRLQAQRRKTRTGA
jgi:hypothetical protein